MTESFEINSLLNEASQNGRAIRLSYPGSEKLTAKVGQIGTSWVEVQIFDNGKGKDGERWLKIALISEATWRSASPEHHGLQG